MWTSTIFILLRGSENDWSPPEDDPGHLSSDSAEPESEIPVARWNQDLPDGSDGVSGAFAELQDDWTGREANEVVALIKSALALASLYQQSALSKLRAKAEAEDAEADGLKAAGREWSLVEAKHKAQQLEDERLRQETVKDGSVIADCHIRALQSNARQGRLLQKRRREAALRGLLHGRC
ncbi:unnamed protein product [Cladocopium goreaui]|uniref:Reticulocyte-binding protein 2-like a n=1 Tax=Cladocopium goreaui TaxID=2562237 RepID=A0A9P1G6E3_9DINO|nr:unnamed protein product [Cladocopium goreaui]